jgi:hypothetical protein
MLALRKSMFAMPAAALEGHVIVDYGLQLGHVIWILGVNVIYYGNIDTHFSLCCHFPTGGGQKV